jgi:hypothetical protein
MQDEACLLRASDGSVWLSVRDAERPALVAGLILPHALAIMRSFGGLAKSGRWIYSALALVAAIAVAGCSVLSARPDDGKPMLVAKCVGTTTSVMIVTLGLALPLVMPAIERGEFVGPCDTLAGIQSPNASGPENAARVREFLASVPRIQPPPDDHRGCCSWHGGIWGCDRLSDRVVCEDGRYSPTCRCDVLASP